MLNQHSVRACAAALRDPGWIDITSLLDFYLEHLPAGK
jgi:hypothetical protein